MSFALAALLLPAAQAAPPFEDGYGSNPTEPLSYAFANVTREPQHDRKTKAEVNLRFRNVFVPKAALDIWFRDADDAEWAYFEPRPRIQGLAYGLEYVVKGRAANGIFYVEFIDSAMGDGYWDDVEDPVDSLDGEYLEPSRGLGIIGLGADYAYEAHLVRPQNTRGAFGLSMLFGGGLGVGVLAGRLDRWAADDQGNPAYKRYLDGEPADSDSQIPRVLPLIDVNAALRFNFGDRVVWRLEGGLHTAMYYGSTFGVTF